MLSLLRSVNPVKRVSHRVCPQASLTYTVFPLRPPSQLTVYYVSLTIRTTITTSSQSLRTLSLAVSWSASSQYWKGGWEDLMEIKLGRKPACQGFLLPAAKSNAFVLPAPFWLTGLLSLFQWSAGSCWASRTVYLAPTSRHAVRSPHTTGSQCCPSHLRYA